MQYMLSNNPLEAGCVQSSQGNYEDELVEEMIKIATTIIYAYGHEWRQERD